MARALLGLDGRQVGVEFHRYLDASLNHMCVLRCVCSVDSLAPFVRLFCCYRLIGPCVLGVALVHFIGCRGLTGGLLEPLTFRISFGCQSDHSSEAEEFSQWWKEVEGPKLTLPP